jgi:hypothetical protein
VTGLGAALFGVSALALKTGTLSWDESLFRILNQVPAGRGPPGPALNPAAGGKAAWFRLATIRNDGVIDEGLAIVGRLCTPASQSPCVVIGPAPARP